MRKIIFVLALVLALGTVSGKPSFEIRKSCEGDEENLFSFYSKKGGNIGVPNHFKWQVCANEVVNAEIKASCNRNEASVISMFKRNDSHASVYTDYRWDVCTTDFQTRIADSCANPIVSIYKESDSHVAEPGYYDKQLCWTLEDPENITLEIKTEAENIIVDGEKAEERTYNPLELTYPYIVTGQPLGIVSYGGLVDLEYKTSGGDVLRVTQNSGSFLVPHTRGGKNSIERRQELVNNRRFLSQLDSSFGFALSDQPEVKVSYRFEDSVTGWTGSENGYIELGVRNRIDDDNQTDLLLRSLG